MSRILVVGMVDSIHLAKWLKRYQNSGLDFEVFAVNPRRRIHPELNALLNDSHKSTYTLLHEANKSKRASMRQFSVYLPKNVRRLLSLMSVFLRSRTLRNFLKLEKRYSHIHLHEMQGAGYAYTFAAHIKDKSTKVILSNWGSDIYHFQKYPFQRLMIKKLLERVDYYMAECHRDFELAIKLGYLGKFLQPVPTSFTFDERCAVQAKKSSSIYRKQITVKCYGGEIGLGKLTINVMRKFLSENNDCIVLLYSVSRDLTRAAKKLQRDYPQRVIVWSIREEHTNAELMNEFLRSRIYIGFSQSDGLSTSLLEAINCGAFGIQSGTSCVGELEALGLTFDITSLDELELFDKVERAWNSAWKLPIHTSRNCEILKQMFSNEAIFSKIERLYSEK